MGRTRGGRSSNRRGPSPRPGAGPGGPAGNPPPAAPSSTDTGDLIDAVKKAISVVTNPIRIGKESGNIEIGASGLTANLKRGDSSLSLRMSWGNSVALEAESGRVGALIKPSVDAVQDAVEAASGIANADRKGGMNFGFKIGSPSPAPGRQGMPGGFETFFVVTCWF